MNEYLSAAREGYRRVLFVGPLTHGSTTKLRLIAFRQLGFEVESVDSRPEWLARRMRGLSWRIQRRLFGDRDEAGINASLLNLPSSPAPDLVWVEKGLTLESATLAELGRRWPKTTLVSFSPDDMFNPRNQSRQWRDCIPIYHIHVSTKTFNVSELHAAGAQRVQLMQKGYSPEVHRPLALTPEEQARFGGDVGFIGWPERARASSIRHLARNGISVRVWGPWSRGLPSANPRIEGRPLWADDYARAICAFRINLCFLRKANRDLQTSRSIEIPACGGFMLAERTAEHQHLFLEDRDAVFFSNDDELLEKVKYYLAHDEERRRIAAAGLERCRVSGYSYVDGLRILLNGMPYVLDDREAA